MSTSVKHEAGHRLKEFLEHCDISPTQAARELDMRLPQLKRILTGKNFRMHWILRMQTAFPSLNISWLVTGHGEMLVDEEWESERQAVELLDEARTLRDRVKELPTKRKAELCLQVIEVAERLYQENQHRRKKLSVIRSKFLGIRTVIKKQKEP